MSYSETVTRTDLTNILNEVLPPPTSFQGEYTILGTTTSDNIDLTLNDDIDNYKFLLVHVVNLEYDAVETTGLIPVSLFKTYNSTAKSFGTNTYNGGRVYGYIHYVDNTTVHTQISTNRSIIIYGLY